MAGESARRQYELRQRTLEERAKRAARPAPPRRPEDLYKAVPAPTPPKRTGLFDRIIDAILGPPPAPPPVLVPREQPTAPRRRYQASEHAQADAEAWRRGAEGEQQVAAALDQLRPHGWWAIHDRRLPGGTNANIDHVVVGPGGVFTVDAKNYRGELTVTRTGPAVNGRSQVDNLKQASSQAEAVSGLLRIPVTPVLCYVGTAMSDDHITEGGVHLVSLRGLLKLLLSSDPDLPSVSVDSLYVRLDASLAPAV